MKEESSPSNETSLHGRDGETCDGVYWKTEVTEAGVGDHQTGPSRAVIWRGECRNGITRHFLCVNAVPCNILGEEQSHQDNKWFFYQLWKKHMQLSIHYYKAELLSREAFFGGRTKPMVCWFWYAQTKRKPENWCTRAIIMAMVLPERLQWRSLPKNRNACLKFTTRLPTDGSDGSSHWSFFGVTCQLNKNLQRGLANTNRGDRGLLADSWRLRMCS